MKSTGKLAFVAIVVLAAVTALLFKQAERSAESVSPSVLAAEARSLPEEPVPAGYGPSIPDVPRLASLGAGACIPCRAMAPIRAELRREYAGVLAVDFYDVWKDPKAGRHFHVWAIPTLIFYDASGRELGRREGFVTKKEILATFRDLGIGLAPVDRC